MAPVKDRTQSTQSIIRPLHLPSEEFNWNCCLMFLTGTLQAACQLVREAGGEVLECVLIVELVELNGRSKVPAPCFSLVQF